MRATLVSAAAFSLAMGAAVAGCWALRSGGLLSATWPAIGAAALLVWVAGLVSLVAVCCFHQPFDVLQAVGIGMLARMGLCLGGGILLTRLDAHLADNGLLGMIVAFYMVGLVVESGLAIWLVNIKHPSRAA